MENNKNAICFSINNEYILYFLIAIQSLVKNLKKKYEIIIFHTDLNSTSLRRLELWQKLNNLNFKVINISSYISHIDDSVFFESAHIKKESYYRIFIPRILKNYDKVLYLDSDILVLDDISDIFQQKLSQNEVIAAVCDIAIQSFAYSNMKVKFNKNEILFNDYLKHYLKIKNVNRYFNAGIILFDIRKCLEIDLEYKSLEKLWSLKNPVFWDQDLLNSILCDNVKILDFYWNYQQNIYFNLSAIPKQINTQYLNSKPKAKIWHFITHEKPWNNLHLEKSELWWKYAKESDFYEELLFENFKKRMNQKSQCIGAVQKIKSHLSFRLGSELLKVKNKKIGIIVLPFSLMYIILKYKLEKWIFKILCDANPAFREDYPLDKYTDYQEALRIKEYFSYRLGSLIINYPFTFMFKINKEYKIWKECKNAK
ncbi:glycosyltransferase family 8 protein [Campylobacter lari]|uniref:glycosyltransferase family 8 protein n=1 Tax=Campylobacter lari TaxID=201 RepID=UPI0037273573